MLKSSVCVEHPMLKSEFMFSNLAAFLTNSLLVSRSQIHSVNVKVKDHCLFHIKSEKFENVVFTLKRHRLLNNNNNNNNNNNK